MTKLSERKPVRFFVVTDEDRYKVVDLNTGGEWRYPTEVEAYRTAWYLMATLGHNYRLEVQS